MARPIKASRLLGSSFNACSRARIGGLFLVLGLGAAKGGPCFNVVGILLHGGFKGESGEGEIATF